MGSFVRILLTSLVLLCPQLCGAELAGHVRTDSSRSASQGQVPHDPSSCPDGYDGCVCDGAIRVAETRHDASAQPACALWLFGLSSLTGGYAVGCEPAPVCLRDGLQTLVANGSGPLVCALLQRVRC